METKINTQNRTIKTFIPLTPFEENGIEYNYLMAETYHRNGAYVQVLRPIGLHGMIVSFMMFCGSMRTQPKTLARQATTRYSLKKMEEMHKAIEAKAEEFQRLWNEGRFKEITL